jgi:hypothetical protein
MNIQYKKFLAVAAVCSSILAVPVSLLHPAFGREDAGTSAAQFLKLSAGARAAAMGDAFCGFSDDSSAIFWNPAGMGQIGTQSFSLTHAALFEGISSEWLSFVKPEGDAVFGFGVQYVSYGSLTGTDETGLETGSFKPSDMAVTLGYSKKIAGIGLGLNLKYISTRIEDGATAFAADVGLFHKFDKGDLAVGFVAQNIGTKIKYEDAGSPLPMNLKFGIMRPITSGLDVSADVNFPYDNEMNVCIGSEYRHKFMNKFSAAVRAGYNTKANDVSGLHGITAGLGLDYCGYRLDYAFSPFGDLGVSHRVGFGMAFDAPAAVKK